MSINGGPREYTLNGKQLSQPCATITATIDYLTKGEAGERTGSADRGHSAPQPVNKRHALLTFHAARD